MENQTAQSPRERSEALVAHANKILEKDTPTAVKVLRTALEADPTYPETYYVLGRIQGTIGCLEAACVLFRKCLSLDPEHLPALIDLQFRAQWSGQIPLAEAVCLKTLDLYPGEYKTWINLSITQSCQGRLQDSVDSARRALALNPGHESQLAMSFAALYFGDFANGLRYHEARYENQMQAFLHFPYTRLLGGEDISNSTVIVVSEQGIGDTLSFTRFIPELARRAARVEIMVHPELARLYQAAMIVYPNVHVRTILQTYPEGNYWTSFMSLPVALSLTNEQIIYQEDIFWPPFHNTINFIRQDAKLNVGLVWAGNKDCAIEKFRRVPLHFLAPLALIPGVQLYSLQIGECQPQIHETGFSTFIIDCSSMIKDVADTFAILRKLDLVITTDTAVGHMCGALGIPCWVMASKFGGDFRIGRFPERDGVLWYPNHKIFMQNEDASWPPVISSIIVELSKLSEGRRNVASANNSNPSDELLDSIPAGEERI